MLKDKSQNVFDAGMRLDSALNNIENVAAMLADEAEFLPREVYKNLSLARNAIGVAMDCLEQAPDASPAINLSAAIADAALYKSELAEVEQRNAELTKYALECVDKFKAELEAMFAYYVYPIRITSDYHENLGDNYYNVYTIEGVAPDGHVERIIRVVITGKTRYNLSNGRYAKRHESVYFCRYSTQYTSLDDCIAQNQDMIANLIIHC